MNKFQLFFFIFVSLISLGVRAECPYSIKDASVMLSLPSEVNVKITSSSMCNQKEYFADRFFDAEIELWKKGKLIGKFYSRKITYDVSDLKIILQNSTLLASDIISNKKLENASMILVDLKNAKLSTPQGEVRF